LTTIIRPFLRALNMCLERLLPPRVYIRLLRVAVPLVDSKRRRSGVRVYEEDGCFVAQSSEIKYFFFSPYNLGRYLFRDRSERIDARLTRKYCHGGVTIEKGDCVVDLGANVGEFTMAIAHLASVVLAVEPDPNPFQCLIRNTAHLQNVRSVQVAAGAENGEMKLFVSPNHNDSSLVRPSDAVSSMRVKVVTVERLMETHGLDHIDFLKVEAEGFEPEILLGARPVLKRIRKIAVDGGPERRGEPTAAWCAQILHDEGFEVYCEGPMVYGVNRGSAVLTDDKTAPVRGQES
jgi:FkbM family methyltransferase